MLLIDGIVAATVDPVLIPLTRLVTFDRTLFASESTPLMLFSRADFANVSLVPSNMLARLLSLALAMVRIAVKSARVSPGPPMGRSPVLESTPILHEQSYASRDTALSVKQSLQVWHPEARVLCATGGPMELGRWMRCRQNA